MEFEGGNSEDRRSERGREGASFLLRMGKPLMSGTIVDDAVLSDGAGMKDTRDRDHGLHFFLAHHRSQYFNRIVFGTWEGLKQLQFLKYDSFADFMYVICFSRACIAALTRGNASSHDLSSYQSQPLPLC